MSLINDALKRARDAQRKNPAAGRTPLPPYRAQKKERDLGWLPPAVIILLIIVAFFFIALAFAHHAVKKIVNTPDQTSTQQIETVSAPAPEPALIGAAAISNMNASTSALVQGIFYDPVHPSAIINDRTVFIGDTVKGMRVTAISRSSITLVGNGRTNILVIGQ
ncbi:MAG TPA: hypothetical protein VFC85_02080 [Verrucomicrobiae bacterium]|nr:hypothetical protein [Verrucomicrobiae bacterium]